MCVVTGLGRCSHSPLSPPPPSPLAAPRPCKIARCQFGRQMAATSYSRLLLIRRPACSRTWLSYDQYRLILSSSSPRMTKACKVYTVSTPEVTRGYGGPGGSASAPATRGLRRWVTWRGTGIQLTSYEWRRWRGAGRSVAKGAVFPPKGAISDVPRGKTIRKSG